MGSQFLTSFEGRRKKMTVHERRRKWPSKGTNSLSIQLSEQCCHRISGEVDMIVFAKRHQASGKRAWSFASGTSSSLALPFLFLIQDQGFWIWPRKHRIKSGKLRIDPEKLRSHKKNSGLAQKNTEFSQENSGLTQKNSKVNHQNSGLTQENLGFCQNNSVLAQEDSGFSQGTSGST